MKEIYKLWKEKYSNSLLEDHGGSPYHKEGSVLTHTLMVYNEAQFDSDFYAIVALLHDIGKPKSVVYKNDRKMFSNHEGLSTFLSVNFLKELVEIEKIDEDEMIDILFLINAHGNIMKYKKSKRHWNLYKYEIEKLEWIKTFNKYDVDGRISDMEYNEAEIKCNAEYIYGRDFDKPNVWFCIGVPNSGKSTWLKEHNFYDLEIVSRDNILLEYGKNKFKNNNLSSNEIWNKLEKEDLEEINKLLNQKIKDLQNQKKDFIIDMTLVSYKSRRRMLGKIKKDYNIHYLNFLTDYETILARNEKRNKEEGKYIPVPVLEMMMKNYQFPLLGEDDRIIDINNIY